MQKTIKKTATKVKFDGMTFLHQSKCDEFNHEPKESLVVNGIRYFKVKRNVSVDDIPDQLAVEQTIDLPTEDEIESIEVKGSLAVNEKGSIETVEEKPKIKYDEAHPDKKTKAKYFYAKTGNYVSYVRAVQLKLV
jgi:hypothetical protein